MSASITYRVSMKDVVEGAERSLSGVFGEDQVRRKEMAHDPNMFIESLEQQATDYYFRSLINISQHQKVLDFVQCEAHFERVLKARLDYSAKVLRDRVSDGKTHGVGFLPCVFMAKRLPTKEQKEAWHARWNDGGDYHRFFQQKFPELMMLPIIYHGLDATMPIQLSVVLLMAPNDFISESDMD